MFDYSWISCSEDVNPLFSIARFAALLQSTLSFEGLLKLQSLKPLYIKLLFTIAGSS